MVAAALVAALALAAPSPQQLLARHVPVLQLARGEPYVPSPVEPFLAAVEEHDGKLDVVSCEASLGPASTGCYAPLTGAPTVYGRAVTTPARVVLQYWLFYPYNPWAVTTPAGDVVWRSHEGDWEHVVVVTDRRGRPLEVGLSQHCGGERRTWTRARKSGTRPVVFVGLGSHANYPAPGTFVHERRCWPEAALVVFAALRTRPVDRAGGGATVRPRLVRLAPAPAWLADPRPWGETGWFHAGEVTLAYGAGPVGPAFKESWRAPLRALARWPLRR